MDSDRDEQLSAPLEQIEPGPSSQVSSDNRVFIQHTVSPRSIHNAALNPQSSQGVPLHSPRASTQFREVSPVRIVRNLNIGAQRVGGNVVVNNPRAVCNTPPKTNPNIPSSLGQGQKRSGSRGASPPKKIRNLDQPLVIPQALNQTTQNLQNPQIPSSSGQEQERSRSGEASRNFNLQTQQDSDMEMGLPVAPDRADAAQNVRNPPKPMSATKGKKRSKSSSIELSETEWNVNSEAYQDDSNMPINFSVDPSEAISSQVPTDSGREQEPPESKKGSKKELKKRATKKAKSSKMGENPLSSSDESEMGAKASFSAKSSTSPASAKLSKRLLPENLKRTARNPLADFKRAVESTTNSEAAPSSTTCSAFSSLESYTDSPPAEEATGAAAGSSHYLRTGFGEQHHFTSPTEEMMQSSSNFLWGQNMRRGDAQEDLVSFSNVRRDLPSPTDAQEDLVSFSNMERNLRNPSTGESDMEDIAQGRINITNRDLEQPCRPSPVSDDETLQNPQRLPLSPRQTQETFEQSMESLSGQLVELDLQLPGNIAEEPVQQPNTPPRQGPNNNGNFVVPKIVVSKHE